MASDNERRFILEMIDSGKITAEEGLHLLQVLPEDDNDEADVLADSSLPAETSATNSPDYSPVLPVDELPVAAAQAAARTDASGAGIAGKEAAGDGEVLVGEVKPASQPPDFDRWRHYWMIPLWIGVGITVAGALLMYWAQQASGVSFWFLCAGVPFTLGVILIALAWQSRSAHWLHLRVHQSGDSWPRVIAFSFPLPLGLFGWIMRTFGVRVPGMETTSVDELLHIIETSTSPEEPLFVEVDEGEGGERVEIYIG